MSDEKKPPPYIVKPYSNGLYGLFRTAGNKTTAIVHGGLDQMENLAAYMNERSAATDKRLKASRPIVGRMPR